MRWLIILPGGGIISSLEEAETLQSLGIIVTSITTQKSVLTVDGTEDINGTTILCQAVLLTSISMRCQSEAVQVIFYGTIIYLYMNMYTILVMIIVYTLTQVLPHHQLT